MKQNDLNRAVAYSTGETVTEISRRGFVPLDDLNNDQEPPTDRNEQETKRNVNILPRRKCPAVAG